MSLAQNSDKNGTFTVTRHAYTETNSLLTYYFDYPASPRVKVGNIISLVYQLNRNKCDMTGSGHRRRYWMYVLGYSFLYSN